jgi:alpha-maltose-1-phosphate synthase
MSNAAIYFHPEAYTTGGPKLMGRNAAGESFLRGFLQYAQVDAFWAQVQNGEHAAAFAQTLQASGRREALRVVDRASLHALATPGAVYFPGPGIGDHAFQRGAFGHAAWSLCGITHTTSSASAMDALAQLPIAPVQVWDALICTSTAVRGNVECVLQAQGDYLCTRLGASRLPLPQLPVIPLGIHTGDFVFAAAERASARQALAVDEGMSVVLYAGRLSFHAKAHPLAMYQALEAAALASGRRVLLIECGWHANDFIARAYTEAAAFACPHVGVRKLDGRDAAQRRIAWAAADVFCSLSDNIQETFGITPIEAMAAGLPVVVADWDGYRDTVRDGIDGFRIPTLMPSAGLGGDLALRHALAVDTYDVYCGLASSLVAVDVVKTTQAFIALFQSQELRWRMGEAGAARARGEFDWASIIPRYQSLWDELAQIRRVEGGNMPVPAHPWPARLDPFYAFAGYPTCTLDGGTRLRLVATDAADALARTLACRRLAMIDFARGILPDEGELAVVLTAAAGTPKSAAALLADIAAARRPQVLRSLAWLVKLGVLEVMN